MSWLRIVVLAAAVSAANGFLSPIALAPQPSALRNPAPSALLKPGSPALLAPKAAEGLALRQKTSLGSGLGNWNLPTGGGMQLPDVTWTQYKEKYEVGQLSPQLRTVYEELGFIKDERWKTEEELKEELLKLHPRYQEADWPLGSTDVGFMDAGDLMMSPEFGGSPDLYPMGPPRVLAVGEVLLDCLANNPMVKMGDADEDWTPYPGGAPANAACALAKLGTPAAFVGSVGEDLDGLKIVEKLKDARLPTTTVQIVGGKETRKVYVTRTLSGDREFAGFPKATDAFADCELDLGQIDGSLFYAAEFCLTGTLGLAYPGTREALDQVKALCDNGQVARFVDVNWRPVFWKESEAKAKQLIQDYIEGAAFLKMTDEEAAWLFEIDKEEAMEKPAKLLERCPGCIGILVTAGAEGCAYAFKECGGRMPAFEIPVVDTTGAGDAFSAGFIHKLIEVSDKWQNEMVEIPGFEKEMPRAHLPNLERYAEVLQDKVIAAEVVTYAAAVGSMTCMEEGAIDAQPPARLANKFYEVYGDSMVITEEKRDFKVDMEKDLLKGWRFRT